MCTISVIGLGIIGTFKGKEAIPYIYNLSFHRSSIKCKHPFYISGEGKYRSKNYF